MKLVLYNPLREFVDLGGMMSGLFDETFYRPYHFNFDLMRDGELLPVDVYETDKDVVVKASLPGIKSEEVEISVDGDCLTIKGEHKEEGKVEEGSYLQKERRWGSFCRQITLPSGLVTDKAEATFEEGVLTVTLPKSEEVKPKLIKVQAKGIVEGKKS